MLINAIAILFSIFTTIISFFPMFALPFLTVQYMNYGVVMFVGALLISMIYYTVHGRKAYQGPVVHIHRD